MCKFDHLSDLALTEINLLEKYPFVGVCVSVSSIDVAHFGLQDGAYRPTLSGEAVFDDQDTHIICHKKCLEMGIGALLVVGNRHSQSLKFQTFE